MYLKALINRTKQTGAPKFPTAMLKGTNGISADFSKVFYIQPIVKFHLLNLNQIFKILWCLNSSKVKCQ